jgi:SP family arabinose:H+ symporter-like MFS transporter
MQRAKKPRAAYVCLIASVAAISGLLFGFDTAVINGALVLLRADMSLTDMQTELAASALLAGCLLGAAGAGSIGDLLGRRKSLYGAAILFALSSVGAALSANLAVFILARIAGGLAIGLASAITPVYISEIAPPHSRGRLVSLYQLAIVTGILIAFLTNWGISALGNVGWRWMFAVGIVPSVGLLAGLLFIPESPRWLITQGRKAEGLAVLERVAGQIAAKTELVAIENAAADASEGSLRTLFTSSFRKRTTIAITLSILQQISGINTVLYYGSVLFKEHFANTSTTSAIGANVMLGVVNLTCTIIAMALIDRVGRRALLLVASGGMAVCLSVLAVALRLPAVAPAVVFASVLLYVAFFAVGLGPVVWVYIAEIFPTRVRGRATSVATTALWAACFVVTLTFLTVVRKFGASGAFSIYAVLSLTTFGFVWKWLPETRGRSLEEIQQLWNR